eukprot:3487481-Prymnesium_polylepis.1
MNLVHAVPRPFTLIATAHPRSSYFLHSLLSLRHHDRGGPHSDGRDSGTAGARWPGAAGDEQRES